MKFYYYDQLGIEKIKHGNAYRLKFSGNIYTSFQKNQLRKKISDYDRFNVFCCKNYRMKIGNKKGVICNSKIFENCRTGKIGIVNNSHSDRCGLNNLPVAEILEKVRKKKELEKKAKIAQSLRPIPKLNINSTPKQSPKYSANNQFMERKHESSRYKVNNQFMERKLISNDISNSSNLFTSNQYRPQYVHHHQTGVNYHFYNNHQSPMNNYTRNNPQPKRNNNYQYSSNSNEYYPQQQQPQRFNNQSSKPVHVHNFAIQKQQQQQQHKNNYYRGNNRSNCNVNVNFMQKRRLHRTPPVDDIFDDSSFIEKEDLKLDDDGDEIYDDEQEWYCYDNCKKGNIDSCMNNFFKKPLKDFYVNDINRDINFEMQTLSFQFYQKKKYFNNSKYHRKMVYKSNNESSSDLYEDESSQSSFHLNQFCDDTRSNYFTYQEDSVMENNQDTFL